MFVQVFLVKKITGPDGGQLYAMKVLKKATLKGLCLSALTGKIINFHLIKQIESLTSLMSGNVLGYIKNDI